VILSALIDYKQDAYHNASDSPGLSVIATLKDRFGGDWLRRQINERAAA